MSSELITSDRGETSAAAAISRRLLPLVAVCVLWTVSSPVSSAQVDATERPRFAMLVGVSRYAHLTEQLDGCRNDVAAMKDVLQTRFGFREEDIVTLLDEQATGDAIRQQMQQLTERVEAAAGEHTPVVVFHFSGHGSQVPDQDEGDPDCDEEDGLDETLVPHDAVRQGGDQDIRDDEIYSFVEGICEGGRAKLWMVLDCCHSGTGARGTTKVRKLHRRHLKATSRSEDRRIQPRRLPPGAVFLSACRATEVEPEYHDGNQAYGLLTRFLVELLNDEPAVSRMSYDLLRESIVARYRGQRSIAQAPTPTLEYGDPAILQETIVDGQGLDRQPLWPVVRIEGDRGRLQMTAGALHGVTRGSLFEIYNSPDQVQWQPTTEASRNGESAGWLEVEKVEGSSAIGRMFGWDGEEKTALRLESDFRRGVAVERFHEHGSAQLRVRVVRADSETKNGPPLTATSPEVPDAVRQAFESAVKASESPWLEWIDGPDACDVVLRLDGDHAALFPATGVASVTQSVSTSRNNDVPRSLVGGWGPVDLREGAEASRQLHILLRRVARARNLIGIVARHPGSAGEAASGGSSPVQIDLELLRVEEVDEDYLVTKSRVWEAETTDTTQSGRLVMHDGDQFAFRIVNREPSGKPVYVTVLHVDRNMGIDQIHPWQPEAGAAAEGEQELAAGESLLVPGYFICNGEEDEAPVYGQRTAIVLATRTPNQFHLLAQEGLPVTRGSGSPLESLLMEQTEFKTRNGFRRKRRPKNRYDSSWGAAAVQWQVVP